MKTNNDQLLLVTGATGLVGSHVIERACQRGLRTRVILRPGSNSQLLDESNVEQVIGDVTDPDSLRRATEGVTCIIHCAAKVGDWGAVDDYREVNVRGLK